MEVIDKPDLPIVFNVNIGHAMPRCIIPFGVEALVDAEKQVIRFACDRCIYRRNAYSGFSGT